MLPDGLKSMESARPSSSPKILIASANRWFSGARLAMGFADAGCRVEIACLPRHPALLTSAIAAHHSFSTLFPVKSLYSAIRRTQPDLVVPTDEFAATNLRLLYKVAPELGGGSSELVRELLRRSLGDPESFPCLASKAEFLSVARAEGVSVLPTEDVPEEAALWDWLERNSLPAVLKADGTSGGEGVKMVRTRAEARRVWRKLRAPVGLARTCKKATVGGDLSHVAHWVKRRSRRVSIQPFVDGFDMNVAAACWKGEMLSAVPMDVMQAWRPKGPAALVQMSKNEEIVEAAATMVRRLGLSGLCGFDFMAEYSTGRTYLIEVNPRATQTCHLPCGIPNNPIPALVAAFTGKAASPQRRLTGPGMIALFPLAWSSGVSKEVLASTYCDVPWTEPRLVEAGLAESESSLYEKLMRMREKIKGWYPLAGEGS